MLGGKGHKDTINIFRQSNIDNSTLLLVSPSFTKLGKKGEFGLLSMGKNILKDLINKRLSEFSFLFSIRLQKLILQRFRNIIFTSLNRQELINAFKSADIFLFPSEIEYSPVVLFECMASKTPFLTNDVGNAKEIISWSNSGLILPSYKFPSITPIQKTKISEAAILLKNISSDFNTLRIMAELGFEKWRKDFTWEGISSKYETLYTETKKEKEK